MVRVKVKRENVKSLTDYWVENNDDLGNAFLIEGFLADILYKQEGVRACGEVMVSIEPHEHLILTSGQFIGRLREPDSHDVEQVLLCREAQNLHSRFDAMGDKSTIGCFAEGSNEHVGGEVNRCLHA